MNVPPADPAPLELTEAPDGAKVPCVGVTLSLTFATGPGADAIVIEKDTTTLRGAFSPFDDSLPAAEVTLADYGGGYVLVTLPNHRYLQRVETSRQDNYTLELYRVDQGVPVQPRIAYGYRDTGFSQVLALQTFALKIQDGTLLVSDLAAFDLRSYPTTPRIGIADPAKPEDVQFFWQQPGNVLSSPAPAATKAQPRAAAAAAYGSIYVDFEHDAVQFAYLGQYQDISVDAGEMLEKTLGRYLERMVGPLTGDVKLSLVIASDRPCVFTFDDPDGLSISYQLLAKSFPDPKETKKVLRFRGGRIGSQEVTFSLPGGSQIESATFRTVQSLAADRLAPGDNPLALSQQLGSGRGVYLGPGPWVAQAATPAAALNLTGLAMGLLDVTGETELTVELQDDWQGQPAGKCLAGGKISLGEAGQAVWALLRLSAPVILPARKHWLVVKASKGSAVWLTQPSDGDAIQVLERRDANGPWQGVSAVMGQAALCRFLVDQAESQPPAILSLDGAIVEPRTSEKDNVSYDFTEALAAYLQKAEGNVVEISLTFTSTAAGIITVYPPEISYDLDSA